VLVANFEAGRRRGRVSLAHAVPSDDRHGAYDLFSDGLPIEPRSARIVLSGPRIATGIGFIHSRLRDLLGHKGNIQRRTRFPMRWSIGFENLPIHPTVSTASTDKKVFKQLKIPITNARPSIVPRGS
jgi:hypothetical protein